MIIQSTDTGVLIDVTETGEVGGIIHGFPYLRLSRTSDFPRVTLCGRSDAGGGQWLYPDGTTCTSTSSPIQYTHNDADGNTIVLSRGTGSFDIDDHELGYKCCLPYSSDNANTDIITANVFSK